MADTGGFEKIDTGGFERSKAPPTQAPPPSTEPPKSSALFGATQLLPEGVQKLLPSFLSGPSVGQQLTSERQAVTSEEQRLGRPLTLAERLKAEPVMESPVAVGMATHEIGAVPAATAKAIASHETALDKQFARAVKPSVSGKQTPGQLSDYRARARDALSSIVANKPNLQFTDDAGTVVKGELPQTLEQFGHAIDQTKQGIFQRYDALARQAGTQGATVDLMPAVRELVQVATSKPVRDQHPELVRYAADLASRLFGRGSYSTVDAQQFIQNHNQAREAFYKNPSYDIAGRAAIDARVARLLREELDRTIEQNVAPGYQELKNQYGSLKEIEKGVTHRAQVVGRQEPGGGILGRIADVGSAEEVIRGLITLNPAAFARGVGLKSWAEYVKYRRSPNRAVKQLFERAEAGPQPTVPISPKSPVLPQPSDQTRLNRTLSGP